MDDTWGLTSELTIMYDPGRWYARVCLGLHLVAVEPRDYDHRRIIHFGQALSQTQLVSLYPLFFSWNTKPPRSPQSSRLFALP
jgi:hypothetical protein